MRKLFFLSLCVLLMTSCSDGRLQNKERPGTGFPANPYLTSGAHKMTHVNSANSDTVPIAGPTSPSVTLAEKDYDLLWLGPIAPGLYDYTYPDGSTIIWTSKPDRIIKLAIRNGKLTLLNEYRLPEGKYPYVSEDRIKDFINKIDDTELASPEFQKLAHKWDGYELYAVSRAMYAMLGSENIFYVGGGGRITAYGDAEPGNPDSPIAKLREFEFDKTRMNQGFGFLFGINMTYDGYIVAVNLDGTVMAISRDFKRSWYYPLGKGEKIWNGLCVDEKGGVYFASNKKIYKLIWTGNGFSDEEKDGAWSEEYEIGSFDESRRISRGSGTAPALMGGPADRDRFVVIADGANVNNIVLYWRDEIPGDWQKPAGTSSRRVASKLPINFGNTDLEDSYSENSIVVWKHGAVIANNSRKDGKAWTIDLMLQGNEPANAPYGIMKFLWNMETRKLEVAWINEKTSISNSTPVISTVTNRLYLAGQRDGVWTAEAINYSGGETTAIYRLGTSQRFNPTYPDVQLLYNGDIAWPAFAGILRLKIK
ncbi:MAG: hypothetical protein GY850_38840 [bacterium]|nr:hypothetical protein [bacterium]